MSILIFDLETTGLIGNTNIDYRDLEKFHRCRTVSIAWSICNTFGNVLRTRYHIIKPKDFNIDDNSVATKINLITTSLASEGSNIEDVWTELANDLLTVDTIVAHNIKFDMNILLSELYRSNREDIIMKLNKTNRYCTMTNSTNICKISIPNRSGYKYPKLTELYKFFYGYDYLNSHNALSDVQATTCCYFKLKENSIYNVSKSPINQGT